MILVFGGTTEGKKAAAILDKMGCAYVYSTKTKIDFAITPYSNYRFGAFTTETLTAFCNEQCVQLILNASHPFATQLHETVAQVALQLQLPVIRLERAFPERSVHKLVHYISSYEEAIDYFTTAKYTTILALTGVQSIQKLKLLWKQQFMYFRILPRPESIAIAAESDFPLEQLILEMPNAALTAELDIIHKYRIDALLTKESGDSGFLTVKIAAAIQAEIPILILERPTLPATFITVTDEIQLSTYLLQTV